MAVTSTIHRSKNLPVLWLSLGAAIAFSTLASAASPPTYDKGESINDPLDLSTIDVTEFIALRYLSRYVKDGILQPPSNSGDKDFFERALTYLIDRWKGRGSGSDAFKAKRNRDETIQIVAVRDGLRAQAEKVQYVVLDVTKEVDDRNYNFDQAGFPFRNRNDNDRYTAQQEIYMQSYGVNILKIDPKTAESWIDDKGSVKAVCKVGRGLGLWGRGILFNLQIRCEKIEFVSPKSGVLATITPAKVDLGPLFDIDKGQ